jgi:hypothetical protein
VDALPIRGDEGPYFPRGDAARESCRHARPLAQAPMMTAIRMAVRPESGHPCHTPRAWHAHAGAVLHGAFPTPSRLSVRGLVGPRAAVPSRASALARAARPAPCGPRPVAAVAFPMGPQGLPKSFGTSFGSNFRTSFRSFFGNYFRRIGPILLKKLPKKSPDFSEERSEQSSELSTPAFQKNSETAQIPLFSDPARYVSDCQNSLREFWTLVRYRSCPRPPGRGRVALRAPACAGGGASRRLRLQLVGRTLPAWGWFPAACGAGAAEEPEGRELTS